MSTQNPRSKYINFHPWSCWGVCGSRQRKIHPNLAVRSLTLHAGRCTDTRAQKINTHAPPGPPLQGITRYYTQQDRSVYPHHLTDSLSLVCTATCINSTRELPDRYLPALIRLNSLHPFSFATSTQATEIKCRKRSTKQARNATRRASSKQQDRKTNPLSPHGTWYIWFGEQKKTTVPSTHSYTYLTHR